MRDSHFNTAGEGRHHGRHAARALWGEALAMRAMLGEPDPRDRADRRDGRHHHGRHGIGRGFGGGGFGPGGFGGGFGPGAPGPDGFGGRGGGPRHAGRRKRLFDQAELQTLLLALISDQPRHGYDLIREIEALSGGAYAPSPGVVYPALAYMEEAGLIAPMAEQGARKAFAPTEAGTARAAEDAEQAAALKERLGALADQRDRVDPAPVRRAIHALRTAVFDRLSNGGADRALILEVADAIDEATRRIERIGA